MGAARVWRKRFRVAMRTGLLVLFCLVTAGLVLELALGWNSWDAYVPDSSPGDSPGIPSSVRQPHITVQLGPAVLDRGQVAEIPITVRDVPALGLASFDLELNFPRDVVKVKEVLPGDLPWTDNSAVVSNRRGLLILSNTKAQGRSGTFILAKLKVEAIGEPHPNAAFSLGTALFRSASWAKMGVSLADGRIEIASPPPGPFVGTPPIGPESNVPEAPSGSPEREAAEAPAVNPEEDTAAAPSDIAPGDSSGAPDLASGWLRVAGNKIVNAGGTPVILRGVNIENREWVWNSNQSIHFEQRAIPEATAPPPDGWGANIVLLAVASGPINRRDATYLAKLDQLVALAKSNGAYTLLVYRYSEPNRSQPNMPDQAAEDAMAALAHRYADEPAVLYGLQVEPHNVGWGQLKPRFTSMIDAIRARNPRALIAVPGTQWSRYVHWALTDPIPRENLVYKVNYYDPFSAAETEYKLSQLAAKYPILLGEFGAGSQMGQSDVDRLLDLAEELNLSWAGWLFHEKGCPCMLSDAGTFSTTTFGAEIRQRLQTDSVESSPPETVTVPTARQAPTP